MMDTDKDRNWESVQEDQSGWDEPLDYPDSGYGGFPEYSTDYGHPPFFSPYQSFYPARSFGPAGPFVPPAGPQRLCDTVYRARFYAPTQAPMYQSAPPSTSQCDVQVIIQ